MEYQFYSNHQAPKAPDKRSAPMAAASMALGILSLTTCSCLFLSLPCSALAIIFALLSRGGETTMNSYAKIGLGFGIAGLSLTILLYACAFAYAIYTYGSLENYLRAYSQMQGMDYEELMRRLYPM